MFSKHHEPSTELDGARDHRSGSIFRRPSALPGSASPIDTDEDAESPQEAGSVFRRPSAIPTPSSGAPTRRPSSQAAASRRPSGFNNDARSRRPSGFNADARSRRPSGFSLTTGLSTVVDVSVRRPSGFSLSTGPSRRPSGNRRPSAFASINRRISGQRSSDSLHASQNFDTSPN
eukprot:1564799-Prymnesium_polylepis.1